MDAALLQKKSASRGRRGMWGPWEDVGTRRSLVIHHVREEEFSVYR